MNMEQKESTWNNQPLFIDTHNRVSFLLQKKHTRIHNYGVNVIFTIPEKVILADSIICEMMEAN